MCSVGPLSPLGLILMFVYPFQAPPWHHNKKRYPPSYGPDGKPRPRLNNVQLKPIAEEREETEEEVHLLNSTTL